MVVQVWWSRLLGRVSGVTAKPRRLFKYLLCGLCRSVDRDRLFSPRAPKVFILEPFVDIFCISKEAYGVSARLVELKAFIKFLEDKCDFVFNINSFDHRIKLQKCVYIAKILGWDCPHYSYNIYMRGPYSPDLTSDYYAIANQYLGLDNYVSHLPKFDADRFAQTVGGKDIGWLEIATTLLSVYKNNRQRMGHDELIAFALERTKEIKANYGDSFITQVLSDLVRYDLLT